MVRKPRSSSNPNTAPSGARVPDFSKPLDLDQIGKNMLAKQREGSYIDRLAKKAAEKRLEEYARALLGEKSDIPFPSGVVLNPIPTGTDDITSEVKIEFNKATQLEKSPPPLWRARQRGRPDPESNKVLIDFLINAYGDYLPDRNNEVRPFICKHDQPLYRAIESFEANWLLPQQLRMPSRNELYAERQLPAEAAGFPGYTLKDRERALKALEKWRGIWARRKPFPPL